MISSEEFENATAVEMDGSLYDAETGEFLSFVDRPTRFAVTDEDSALWVLGKMLTAEAALASVQQSPEVIRAKAVLENAARIEKEQRTCLESLHRHFDPELGEYARIALEGKKTKTLKTLLGSISLRTVKGGVRYDDTFEKEAIEWAEANYPNAIQTKRKFLPSLVPDALKDGTGDLMFFFEVEAKETITVTTGVTNA